MNLTDENIIIAGASGLLGTELSKFFHEKKIAHKNLSKNSDTEIICDLTSLTETLNLFEKYKPTILINLVALTDVDRCEVNINEAYKINTKTVENIVQASKNLENFFLFIFLQIRFTTILISVKSVIFILKIIML
jgi:dTDP-4-dehydrorhamnose reductase